MILKALEARLKAVEADSAAMLKEQRRIMTEIEKSKNDNHQLLVQMMTKINEQFADLEVQRNAQQESGNSTRSLLRVKESGMRITTKPKDQWDQESQSMF